MYRGQNKVFPHRVSAWVKQVWRETGSRRQQTQRTLFDWLRVEYVKGSVQENVMLAPKELRPSELMAVKTLIGGRTGNMRQTLKDIDQSACLWACPGVGFQHEQS